LILHVVVLELGLVGRLIRIAHDLRTDEDHQVGLAGGLVARLEEQTEERNVAEVRYAALALGGIVLDESAEHHDAAVLDQYRGADRALVGHEVHGAGGLLAEARAPDRDLEHDLTALGPDG